MRVLIGSTFDPGAGPLGGHTQFTRVGSRKESIPPNAWTETGRTPVRSEAFNSRHLARPHGG